MNSPSSNNSVIPVFLMRHGHSCANFYLLKYPFIKKVSRVLHKNSKNLTISKMHEWINGNNNRDSYLNELGILQAIVAGYLFKEKIPTIYYTSAMFRAIQTCTFFLFGMFLTGKKINVTVNVTPYLKEDGPATSDILKTEEQIKDFCRKLPMMFGEILKNVVMFMSIHNFNTIFPEIYEKILIFLSLIFHKKELEEEIFKTNFNINFKYTKVQNDIMNYSDPNKNYFNFIELLNNKPNTRSNDIIMIVSHNHTISKKFCKSGIFDENLENTSISKLFYNRTTSTFNNSKNANIKKIGKCRIIYSPPPELSPKKVFNNISNSYIQTETICNKMKRIEDESNKNQRVNGNRNRNRNRNIAVTVI